MSLEKSTFQFKPIFGNNLEICLLQGNPADLPGYDTGGILWKGGDVLAKFLAESGIIGEHGQHTVALELGCGCGLSSLVLGSFGVETVATDGEPKVVDIMEQNVAANGMILRAKVHAKILRWEDNQGTNIASISEAVLGPLNGRVPSLIIAADVLYFQEGNIALGKVIRTLNSLHAASNKRNPASVNSSGCSNASDFRVLIAWQVRHEVEEATFFSNLSDVFVATLVRITHTCARAQIDRQTDRQSDRQTDRQVGRQAGRETNRNLS
jgi:hypothetical protein